MKKILVIIIVFVVFLISLLGYIHYYSSNDSYLLPLKKIIPEGIKHNLKKTIFIVPDLKKKNDYLMGLSKLINKPNDANYVGFSLKKIPLDLYNSKVSNQKPVAYLETIEDKVLLISGNGLTYFFRKEGLKNKENINLFKIENNLKDLINDKAFWNFDNTVKHSKDIGIRGILYFENKIYVSYNKSVTENCYNTSIISADFNLKSLNFSDFFTYKECVDSKLNPEFNSSQSGGKLKIYNENNEKKKLLFTIGEYGNRELAQDKESLFGKIITIDFENRNYDIFSMGHRNPQGLFVDEKFIISTEHGPYGGDEINLIKKNKNYGWPLASYGEKYGYNKSEDFSYLKSHKKFNFVEPIFAFVPSIGISEIVKIPEKFSKKLKNNYFICSLNGKTLYRVIFNEDLEKIISMEPIYIGERIRDIEYDQLNNVFLLILENTPLLGILSH